MQRYPIVIAATAAGLTVTLGFQAYRPAASVASSGAATTSTGTTASGSSSSSSSSSASGTKTVTSTVEANRYGNVQLKVTVSGGKITAVQALQLPQNDPKSAEINAYAEPILQQSALTAQSASIDTVSGATYTSDSYRAALQSALDQAGVATGTSSASAAPGTA